MVKCCETCCEDLHDDPNLDCTDFAHPAWWRAHDYTADRMVDEINSILDNPEQSRMYGNAKLMALAQRLQKLATKSS